MDAEQNRDQRGKRHDRVRRYSSSQVRLVAGLVENGFDQYAARFLRITRRAKRRFAQRDWQGHHQDSIQRFDLYERRLDLIAAQIEREVGAPARARAFWTAVKERYGRTVSARGDYDLAETFFNSVTRKVLQTTGIDREVEFFRPASSPAFRAPAEVVYRRYERNRSTPALVRELLEDFDFPVGYENLERDAERVAGEIDLYLWPMTQQGQYDSIDVIKAPFYRNKVAYVVGRVNVGERRVPLIMPLYNDAGGMYVDAVLLTEAEASIVFSFAYSYFHVEVQHHGAVIAFLRSILPEKPIADLYSSLGYYKHGKTEFYRSLHQFVHEAKERFIIAPGKEGAVMIGFTLPEFDYVFKVIKDRPCYLRSNEIANKQTSRSEVRERYALVCHRDRVGRMVDTQEFENLRFKRKRFSQALLREFRLAAGEAVAIGGDHVVINQLYVQRRVLPMPMFLQQEQNPERVRRVILDFGFFLKDLAASGIFPYDLFNTWNYGVTRRLRVVLFDYDDVQPLELASFLEKPPVRGPDDEMVADEDRIAARSEDFFMDEIERFSGIPVPLRPVFDAAHADLYSLSFWRSVQARVLEGEIMDITPYDRRKRFARPL